MAPERKIYAAENEKKAHPQNGRHARNENTVFYCNLIRKLIKICRRKKRRSPLERSCGMYKNNMVFVFVCQKTVPGPCLAHPVPFRGDSILFRLPRQSAGTVRRCSLPGCPAGWPVHSLNNKIHLAKHSLSGCFHQVYVLFFVRSTAHFMSKRIFDIPCKKTDALWSRICSEAARPPKYVHCFVTL